MPRSADSVPVGSSTERYEFRDDGTLLLTFADGTTEVENWELEGEDVLAMYEGDVSRRFSLLSLTTDELILEEIPRVAGAPLRRYELIHP